MSQGGSRGGEPEDRGVIMLLISRRQRHKVNLTRVPPNFLKTVCERGSLLITLSTKLVDVNAGTRRAALVQYYFYYGVSKRVRRGFHFPAFAHGCGAQA